MNFVDEVDFMDSMDRRLAIRSAVGFGGSAATGPAGEKEGGTQARSGQDHSPTVRGTGGGHASLARSLDGYATVKSSAVRSVVGFCGSAAGPGCGD